MFPVLAGMNLEIKKMMIPYIMPSLECTYCYKIASWIPKTPGTVYCDDHYPYYEEKQMMLTPEERALLERINSKLKNSEIEKLTGSRNELRLKTCPCLESVRGQNGNYILTIQGGYARISDIVYIYSEDQADGSFDVYAESGKNDNVVWHLAENIGSKEEAETIVDRILDIIGHHESR